MVKRWCDERTVDRGGRWLLEAGTSTRGGATSVDRCCPDHPPPAVLFAVHCALPSSWLVSRLLARLLGVFAAADDCRRRRLVYLKCERGVNTWRPDMLYLQFEDEGRERGGGVIRLRTYVGGGRGALRFLVCVCADGV